MSGPEGIIAEGEVAGTLEGGAFRLVYRLDCAANWAFRAADLQLAFGREQRSCRVARAGDGAWQVDGAARPDLARSSAIDIMVTPLTNTIPVRTLAFVPAMPVTLSVACVPVPSLEIVPREQEYEPISPGRLRDRNLESGFTAELEVDADGLVERYGELWRRA
ncbi:MAG: putative glycolipid-binding domain-containing protein [Acetobacteraceae bacterium]